MCGVQLVGLGGFDKLVYREDLPTPAYGPRDVLIRVSAAAVNNTDINTRIGWYSKSHGEDVSIADDAAWTGSPVHYPRIQGADACGMIVAVGGDVSEGRIGERVVVEPSWRELNGEQLAWPAYFGSECDGAFAQYCTVPSQHAHRIDSDLTDTELASFPCSYSTAENLLTRSSVKDGERVLVTGASGGVGSAAVQLASARGAAVTALTTTAKSAAVKQLGASEVVTRDRPLDKQVGSGTIDVVVDLVGGTQFPLLLDLLKPGGRYATSGAIGGAVTELDLRTLYLKDLTLFGCTALGEGVFSQLVTRIESGDIAPLIASTYRLEDIVEAQQHFLRKEHVGKIVLTVQ